MDLILIVCLVAGVLVGVGVVVAVVLATRPRPRTRTRPVVARPVVARPVGSSRWANSLPELLGLCGLILFGLVAAAVTAYLGVGLSVAELAMLGVPAVLYLIGFVWLLRLILGRQPKPVRATPQPSPPPLAFKWPDDRESLVRQRILAVLLSLLIVWGLVAMFREVVPKAGFGLNAVALYGIVLAGILSAIVGLLRWGFRRPPQATDSPSQAAISGSAAGPPGLGSLSPAMKRFVAGLVPTAILLLISGTMLVYGYEARYTRGGRWELEAVIGFAAGVVLTVVVHRRLSRWAYPEWWRQREELLYPDRVRSAAKAVPVPAVAIPVAAPAPPPRACPKCGRAIAAGAPEGLCPRCLIGDLLPDDPRLSPTTAYGPFVPPEVEEVAAFFPQLEIVRLVGQGGMGAVYLARQKGLDRMVALKLIRVREDDPTFAERFAREAKAMGKLGHPNIVTIHDHGTADGLPYLVMEYVDGVTLRDAMRAKSLSHAEVLKVIPQICDALEYAHAQGVVHRDVKPENILLDKSGKVKIADFGLAKLMDPDGMSLTHTRQAMGTPHYMAPEQWERPTEVDHRADIYALGVLLYELLTGELPLGRFDPPSVKSRMDARIDELVLRALAKEPDRRYQHASDVKLALERLRTPSGWACAGAFREYKSKTTFLGWPLVHVVSGRDPVTGRPKVARGWLAIGDSGAVGAVALAGGWAVGGVALAGGSSVGLVALAGGFAAGVLALAGGGAVGGLAAGAGGGAAAGVFAGAGGFAAGRFAAGGGAAFGEYVIDSRRQDPDFWAALSDWLAGWWPVF